MPNPLVSIDFRIPFDRIRAEHVEPAVDELLADAQAAVDALAASDAPPTFANTLLALEKATERLEYAMTVVGHLESAATYPQLREAHNRVQPKVSAFYSGIPLHEGLWRRIRAFAATEEAAALAPVRARFLKQTLNEFRRAGADLDEAGKKRLTEINVALARRTTSFAENVLDATNAFEHYIDDEAGLAGLPPSARDAARQSAESKGRGGWRFTLQAPSYTAVMTYLDDAAAREKVYRAYATRAAGGAFDNRANIAAVLDLRKEKAQLLGYADFADLALENRMAKNGAQADEFVRGLTERTRAAFERENEALRAFAGKRLDPWDTAYYAEKMRQAQYDFDEEELRPYFPYEGVLKGLFEIAGRLFGIRVEKQSGVPVWDPSIDYYTVSDADGSLLGSFYADYFPRENKRGGAWMNAFLTGEPRGGGFTPHLGLNCGNLTPPVGGKPALLTHREVETIFHEFGHLLHHLLSRVEIKSLAGTRVAWDWVELPSQIMENWCWEREALDLFARHYETGEAIPQALFEKMRRARNFRAANAQMRQLGFGTVDLALHMRYDPRRDGDALVYAWEIAQAFAPAPLPADHAMIAGFTHLFADPVGYGAGYYSYKWSEVLDADAFTRFAAEGIFNPRVGREFRENVLAKGDSEPPEKLFRGFMGRGPDAEALMRRIGLAA